MCPLKLIKINKRKEEWISTELVEQIALKDQLLRKANTTNKAEDWARARKARNETKSWVKRAKSEFIQNQLENNANDQKFWRNIRNIIPTGKQQSHHINLVVRITKSKIPDEQTANYINEYFTTIASKLTQNLNYPWNYNDESYAPAFSLVPTNIVGNG